MKYTNMCIYIYYSKFMNLGSDSKKRIDEVFVDVSM